MSSGTRARAAGGAGVSRTTAAGAARATKKKTGTSGSKASTTATGRRGRGTGLASSSSRSSARTATSKKTTAPTTKKTARGRAKAGTGRGRAGTGAKTGVKKKQKKKAELSPEEKQRNAAATMIQRNVRRMLAQQHAEQLKKQKENYEKSMEQLEREAFVALVKREQEQEQQRVQLEMQRRKEKKEQQKREKDMREAAFDGEMETLRKLFANFEMDVDAADGNGDTPLLEAAGGGQVAVVNLLLSRGADVNAKGRFNRTPLYRAAFGGHGDVVRVLLEAGGDPRLYDSEGITPQEVAANDSVASIFKEWDIAVTDAKLVELESQRQQQRLAEKARREEATNSVVKEVENAQATYKAHRTMLTKARMELEKRIREYDKMTLAGDEHLQSVTLQTVKDAEAEVARLSLKLEAAELELRNARLKLREQRREEAEAEAEESDDKSPAHNWLKCTVRELEDVLIRDVGDRIADSGKWPLLIDRSKQVATFLRYRDTNYVNMCSPYDTEKERLRMALLGAVRYAKPLVLDLMDVDAMTLLEDRFNEIEPDLFLNITNKNVMHDFCYRTLIRKEDGKEYELKNFNQARIDKHFQVFLVTQEPLPDEDLVSHFFPIEVLPAGATL